MSATQEIWDEIAPVYRRVMEHPFLTGLTDGTLPVEVFQRYVVQDALFLRDYARALALCAARAPDADTLRMFCRHASEAIDVERDLHERLMGELDVVPPPEDEPPPLTPTCLAYTSFLLSSCALRERHDALAAVLPCYWVYWEVGKELAATGSPDPRYQVWIDTYAGDQFAAAVRGAIAACDAVSADLSPDARASARAHALTAARYEWMFWDSAYRLEAWPV